MLTRGEETGFSTADLLELLLGYFMIAVKCLKSKKGGMPSGACPPFYLLQVVKNVFPSEYRSFIQLIFNPQ